MSAGALLAACRGNRDSEKVGAQAPPSASRPADQLARADEAARRFSGALRAKLTQAIASAGPAKAIDVCASEAPALSAQIRGETGVAVGRASLRLRTPADAPPPWVAEWLTAQGERPSEGVRGLRTVADGGAGKVARVLLPIGIEKPCLACHGDSAELAPEVKTALDTRYPTDRATGYRLGDLRGALWAEAAVPLTRASL